MNIESHTQQFSKLMHASHLMRIVMKYALYLNHKHTHANTAANILITLINFLGLIKQDVR